MQIGAKDIENLLMTVMLTFSFEKTYFHSSLHANQLNRFYLKLSKKRFMKLKVVLLKPNLMHNRHNQLMTIPKDVKCKACRCLGPLP
jgi:hypothetical protein